MRKQKNDNPIKINFEEGIARLEQIVGLLDKNELSLEQALELFQEGIELVKNCNFLLDTAEAKVNILLETEQGRLKADKLILSGE